MASDDLTCKLECQELVFKFGAALDRAANSEAADLFAPDGRIIRPESVVEGPAVREALMKRPADLFTRHIVTNLVISPAGPEKATGFGYVSVLRGKRGEDDVLPSRLANGGRGVGEWHLEFSKGIRGWQIQSFRTVAVMTDD